MLCLLRKYATGDTISGWNWHGWDQNFKFKTNIQLLLCDMGSSNLQQSTKADENVEPDKEVPAHDNKSYASDTSDFKLIVLVKHFFVCTGFIALIVAVCTICEYETEDFHLYKLSNALQETVLGPFILEFVKLQKSSQIYYPLLAINILIHPLYKIKVLAPIVNKYFCSHPTKGAPYSAMLLSTFNHLSLLHLGANMFALNSFISYSVTVLGRLQFVALYLCAAVFSSLTSTMYKVIFKRPTYSLGASGAIMGIIIFGFTHGPDAPVAFIFCRSIRFPAYKALYAILIFEFIGVMLKWQFFDHAGHLGGSLFGMVWYYWGSSIIWDNRDMFLDYYITVKDAIEDFIY